MNKQNLLVELGTEELPPKALKKLAMAFAESFEKDLKTLGVDFGSVKWFATPRRLAVIVDNVAEQQPDKVIEKKGPAVSSAYKDGKPTPAAEGWAKSNGITVDQAERLKTDKGEWLVFKASVKGKKITELVGGIIDNAVKALPVPKMMHWGSTRFEFVRPVHTFCVLFGSELVDVEMFGVKSSRTIRGHRFMGQQEFEIGSADEYLEKLETTGSVVADYERRYEIIKSSVQKQAHDLGGKADLDEALLNEVTSLVEWPAVLTAKFEEKFLKVPAEALVYTMKGDQKYFPVYDESGKLLPNFIFVSNIDSNDKQQVIAGNEKVVRPRLSDAEFFFNTDKKQTLASRIDSLGTVLFQKQLGTLKDRVERISKLAEFIADKIGTDKALAARAGLLSKCDLMTNMVMEFTDTQGVMGMHYARIDGEPETVAVSLFEQYLPRFVGDNIPSNDVSAAVNLADKFDTLVGIFGIGMLPKGDKDPFGLRRAAIGVLRIIVEREYNLDINEIIAKSAELYGDKLTSKTVASDVFEYILARFKANYQDSGIKTEVILAVLARKPACPYDFHRRVQAVSKFADNPAAESLSAANKRVSNILAKSANVSKAVVDRSLLVEEQEKCLFNVLESMKTELAPAFAEKDYDLVLGRLAELKDPVDCFFDKVMVNADDEKVKANRHALLNELRELFLRIADISLL